ARSPRQVLKAPCKGRRPPITWFIRWARAATSKTKIAWRPVILERPRAAGVKQIIYLGGLGESDGHLSPHLRSRREVGRILRESGVPVIEFRASIVIGSGSLSFEMIR